MRLRGFCDFYENLYIGESVKNPKLVKWKLKHGAGQLFIYVITASECKDNQLEIQHCGFLKQKYYLRHRAYIYGICGSYNEALDMVLKITQESVMAGMDGDLIRYLDSVRGQ